VYPTIDKNYKHFEGNSHAHMKSSTMGVSQTLILNDGMLILGRWQDIYFCEFDGPRERTFYVKIVKG
ncbi:secondary thiamine-phosphate synthase enzyme YjbQ, partial [Clostridium perfringens]